MSFPLRVLIVDDDPLQRAVLEQIFTTHGSTNVEVGANGLDAISILENSDDPFDLIVLDLVMPEYDGIKLISYLESQNVRARILLLSGLPKDIVRMSNTLAKASGLKSIGSLQKPLRLEDLQAIVQAQRWPQRKARRSMAEYIPQLGHA